MKIKTFLCVIISPSDNYLKEWCFDVVPQIMDGMNVFDYVDSEIDMRLR